MIELGPVAVLSLFAVPLLLGSAVLRLLGLRPCEDRLAFAGWAYALGCLVLSLLLFCALLLRVPLAPAWILPPVLLLALASLARRLPAREPGPSIGPPPAAGWERFVFALCMFLAVVVVLHRARVGSLHPILAGDEATIWASRAQVLHDVGGFGDDYREAVEDSHLVRHPDYPPLNPLLQVWAFLHAGRILHFDGRLPLVGVSVALILLLGAGLRRLVRPGLAAALVLLVLTVKATRIAAQRADADVLVAVGFLITLDAADRWRYRADPRYWCLAWLGLALCAWAKNEGTMLLLVAGTGLLLLPRPEQPGRRPAWPVLASVLLVVLHSVFNTVHRFQNDLMHGDPDGRSLWDLIPQQFADRAGAIVLWFGQQMVAEPIRTQGILAAFLLTVLLFPVRCLQGRLRFPTLALLVALGGFFFVYVGSFLDLSWHLSTSAHRITFQLIPALTFWLALASGQLGWTRDPTREWSR